MCKRANAIVAADDYDDPSMIVVIEAALTYLIASEQNIDDARGDNHQNWGNRACIPSTGYKHGTKPTNIVSSTQVAGRR